MRLIDADVLYAALMEMSTIIARGTGLDCLALSCKAAAAIVQNAPTIDAVPRWIPCEERLPEPNVAVLGYAPKFNNIFAVYYDSICGWMTWSPVGDEPFPSCQGEIVAWMPMPEPWKEEDDEKAQRR